MSCLSLDSVIVLEQGKNWAPDVASIRNAGYQILGPCVRTAHVTVARDSWETWASAKQMV